VVLLLIAAVVLLVSGIGIMNIMLATVSSRTREIGIRKAVAPPTARSASSSSPKPFSFAQRGVLALSLDSQFLLGPLSHGLSHPISASPPSSPSWFALWLAFFRHAAGDSRRPTRSVDSLRYE